MHRHHRRLKHNLRSRTAAAFDSEFALEVGTTAKAGKSTNHTDLNNSIDMSMLNGSGVNSR